MATKKYQIPFDENGKLVAEVRSWNSKNVHEWRDNELFHARLEFMHISKGQYSDKFVFEDAFGNTFQMTSNNFMKVVKLMEKGFVEGEFTYAKWHDTYGVAYVGEGA